MIVPGHHLPYPFDLEIIPSDDQVRRASELVRKVMEKFDLYDRFMSGKNHLDLTEKEWEEVVYKVAEIAVMTHDKYRGISMEEPLEPKLALGI